MDSADQCLDKEFNFQYCVSQPSVIVTKRLMQSMYEVKRFIMARCSGDWVIPLILTSYEGNLL